MLQRALDYPKDGPEVKHAFLEWGSRSTTGWRSGRMKSRAVKSMHADGYLTSFSEYAEALAKPPGRFANLRHFGLFFALAFQGLGSKLLLVLR